jgi:hypothetical protein
MLRCPKCKQNSVMIAASDKNGDVTLAHQCIALRCGYFKILEKPMNINIDSLREMTAKAIRDGEEKVRKEIADKNAINAAAEALAKAKANTILLQVAGRAEREAKAGRNHAVIMGIKYNDFVPPCYNNLANPEHLAGTAAIVWQELVKSGLNPTLESWHDGMGIKGGHNIVIHWPNS